MLAERVVERFDGRAELRLSGPAGAAIGFGLAVVMLSPLLLASKLAGMQFLAVQLAFIGAIYFGFGVANGEVTPLLVEFLVAGAFLFGGAVALWADSPIVLVAGYAAHAGWDLLHHPQPRATVPVKNWYPPFCVVYDLVCAVFILVWLPLGGVA